MTPYERRQADIRRARNRGWAVFWREYVSDAAYEAHGILNAAEQAIKRGDAWGARRELARAQRAITGAKKASAGRQDIAAVRQEAQRRYDALRARIKGWPKGTPPPPRAPVDERIVKMAEREEREMGRRIRYGLAREEREATRAIDELERVRRGRR
jgi:hypothetical protein